jgi:hypothetical protein
MFGYAEHRQNTYGTFSCSTVQGSENVHFMPRGAPSGHMTDPDAPRESVRAVMPGSYRWPGAHAFLRDAPEEIGRSASQRSWLGRPTHPGAAPVANAGKNLGTSVENEGRRSTFRQNTPIKERTNHAIHGYRQGH